MVKGGYLFLITIVLLVSALGYISQLITNGVDLNASILFMMGLLVLFVVLKKIRLD